MFTSVSLKRWHFSSIQIYSRTVCLFYRLAHWSDIWIENNARLGWRVTFDTSWITWYMFTTPVVYIAWCIWLGFLSTIISLTCLIFYFSNILQHINNKLYQRSMQLWYSYTKSWLTFCGTNVWRYFNLALFIWKTLP